MIYGQWDGVSLHQILVLMCLMKFHLQLWCLPKKAASDGFSCCLLVAHPSPLVCWAPTKHRTTIFSPWAKKNERRSIASSSEVQMDLCVFFRRVNLRLLPRIQGVTAVFNPCPFCVRQRMEGLAHLVASIKCLRGKERANRGRSRWD